MQLVDIQKYIQHANQLQIIGLNSQKQQLHSPVLDMSKYSGLISYHPEELVLTVKAGTSIHDLENILSHNNQVLPFAHQHQHQHNTTIGGAYAIGSPSLRDTVLGVKIIDGRGQLLNFGGQVMKNVAGYDVARLLVGSRGKYAAICEISFRVLPDAYRVDQSSQFKLPEHASASFGIHYIQQGLKQVFDPHGVFV